MRTNSKRFTHPRTAPHSKDDDHIALNLSDVEHHEPRDPDSPHSNISPAEGVQHADDTDRAPNAAHRISDMIELIAHSPDSRIICLVVNLPPRLSKESTFCSRSDVSMLALFMISTIL